jgi:flagellar biosynthesis anti-sigma factor FlgM
MMGEIRKTAESSTPVGVIHDITQARRRAAPEPTPPSDADRTAIGETARQAATALSVVQSTPDIRADRVARLQSSIARGDYQPDAREIAREILARGL